MNKINYEALAIADYCSPHNTMRSHNGNRPLVYRMYAAQNADINTQDAIRPCWESSFV